MRALVHVTAEKNRNTSTKPQHTLPTTTISTYHDVVVPALSCTTRKRSIEPPLKLERAGLTTGRLADGCGTNVRLGITHLR
jgi:hypothetical protein